MGLPAGYSDEEIRSAVRDVYEIVARSPYQKFEFPVGRNLAESVGYDARTLARLPPGLTESFAGAGNPLPFVDARPGETLLDLGCGAGLDLYFYAGQVGPEGRLYGLDFAPAMIEKAQANLAAVGLANAEWFTESAERIPLADASVDLVTANGLFNLVPDKDALIRETARVLKPGGRFYLAVMVLVEELPAEARHELVDWFRSIGGALVGRELLGRLESHGLKPRILHQGRNARTSHALAMFAVIRAEKA